MSASTSCSIRSCPSFSRGDLARHNKRAIRTIVSFNCSFNHSSHSLLAACSIRRCITKSYSSTREFFATWCSNDEGCAGTSEEDEELGVPRDVNFLEYNEPLSIDSAQSASLSESSAGDELSKGATIDIKLPRRNLLARFTCGICGERSERLINRLAYERGLVYVQCAGCKRYHKLADNLGLVVEYDLRDRDDL